MQICFFTFRGTEILLKVTFLLSQKRILLAALIRDKLTQHTEQINIVAVAELGTAHPQLVHSHLSLSPLLEHHNTSLRYLTPPPH